MAKKHVFVCLQNRPVGHARGSCQSKGSREIYDAFVALLTARGMEDSVRLTHSGCLGPCAQGPSVVVYPDSVYYGGITVPDVAAIVDEHLIRGTPVERLASDW
ncbi:MAG TPA: (2Fe-2S) ferredoxin domain-containing protein [Polyangiales bacterium]